MILYQSGCTKLNIGQAANYIVSRVRYAHNYLRDSNYVILIQGFAVVEPEGRPEQFFIPKDTPYVIWRERRALNNKFFYMKLDLKNPSAECGGNLTMDQAITAVTDEIRASGHTDWPNENIHNLFITKIAEAKNRRLRARALEDARVLAEAAEAEDVEEAEEAEEVAEL